MNIQSYSDSPWLWWPDLHTFTCKLLPCWGFTAEPRHPHTPPPLPEPHPHLLRPGAEGPSSRPGEVLRSNKTAESHSRWDPTVGFPPKGRATILVWFVYFVGACVNIVGCLPSQPLLLTLIPWESACQVYANTWTWGFCENCVCSREPGDIDCCSSKPSAPPR